MLPAMHQCISERVVLNVLVRLTCVFIIKRIEICQDMTSGLKEVLDAVTPTFEEYERRAFTNEGISNEQIHGSRPIKLDDVFVTIENTIVELRNLKITRTPSYRIKRLNFDIGMFTMHLGLSLGDLRIEGEYEATNKALQNILPMSQIGKIVVILKDVVCNGIAGLVIKEDSFVHENFDVKYQLSEVSVQVYYYKEGNVEIVTEVTETEIDKTLAKTFWSQLTEELTHILYRQLGAVTVEYSVGELMQDEPEELIALSKQHSLRANRLLDELLCSAKTYLVEQNGRTVQAPPLSVIFKCSPRNTQQGTLVTEAGEIQDLSTLTRSTQMSLFEDKDVLYIYGEIMLRDFKFIYERYRSEYANAEHTGSIKATIYRSKIFVKISVHKLENKCVGELNEVQISSIRDIDVDVSGLGSLSWVNDRLRSWVIGQLRNQGFPTLEAKISEALKYAIANTNCASVLED